ncbi:MAG: hypothetical protein WEF51_02005 [Chloroflexota bacterium]
MSASPDPARAASVTWPMAMLGGALGALSAPAAWPVALAGFLARGGLVLFLLPIVVLPTPAGVANVVAPWLVPFVFGQVSLQVVAILATIAAVAVGWVVAGGILGGWADVALIRDAAANEELGFGSIVPPPRRRAAAQVFALRLIAHAPLAAALAWGAARIGQAGYRELINPLEVVSPLAVRVIAAVPDAVALLLVTWLIGEAAGGLAARHFVLGGATPGHSLREGYLDLVRYPSSLATLVLTTFGLLVTLVPSVVAAGVGWSWARVMLLGGALAPEAVAAIVLFVVLWLGGLALAAGVVAWRSYAWTAEWLRRRVGSGWDVGTVAEHEVGTIGGSGSPRPGGWSSTGSSGTV